MKRSSPDSNRPSTWSPTWSPTVRGRIDTQGSLPNVAWNPDRGTLRLDWWAVPEAWLEIKFPPFGTVASSRPSRWSPTVRGRIDTQGSFTSLLWDPTRGTLRLEWDDVPEAWLDIKFPSFDQNRDGGDGEDAKDSDDGEQQAKPSKAPKSSVGAASAAETGEGG